MDFVKSAIRSNAPIMDQYSSLDAQKSNHAGHAFPTTVLRSIETYLPSNIAASAETGCGKSTILFSNYSQKHYVFSLDDRNYVDQSSVLFYENHELTKLDRVVSILGPSQDTLPKFQFPEKLDLVLIDGAHAYPFPELEYYYFYPHLKPGALLIVDDVSIPTIGRMADVLAEDEMFEFIALISTTALFRRTDAPTFDPFGDGWWTQRYNRRRVPSHPDIFIAEDNTPVDLISSLNLASKTALHLASKTALRPASVLQRMVSRLKFV